MDIILDTHALLWMLLADPRLGERQRRLIENPANRIHISVVSAFEITTKVRIGKLPEGAGIAAGFETVCQGFDYQTLPLLQSHALRAGRLEGIHRDPFDRLIAGQAIAEEFAIVTNDPAFKEFGVEVVW